MRLLIYGFGYCAEVLYQKLQARGDVVWGTSRTETGRFKIFSMGGQAINPFDGTELRRALGETDALLVSAPPTETGCPALQGLRPLWEDKALRPEMIIYLSTTGVYGDRGGRWVFETSALLGQSQEGLRRIAAETAWQTLANSYSIPLVILRLPGIYGPVLQNTEDKGQKDMRRNPFIAIKQGLAKRYDTKNHVFSRIHVEDVAQALTLCLDLAGLSGVYNICDDLPAPACEVLAYAAELMGLAPPVLIPFDLDTLPEKTRRFYQENKRVSNAKAKAVLAWKLIYPDYRSGLKAIWEAGAI